ncbi:MAG: hypothetical protein VZS44_11010 [Bacilli bacterium]|nr:hypothetical protein [Bacilli bacterium]
MNIVLHIILIISAIAIIIFDYKTQRIPIWLIIINYSTICLITNKWLLLGVIFILFSKWKDIPVDWVFVLLICYVIYLNKGSMVVDFVVILLSFAYSMLFTDENGKISYLVPLEIGFIIELSYQLLKSYLII